LEPGLLGLLIAPSWGGLCIAFGALVGFVARTPLKIAAIDHRRGRHLPRTTLARRFATVESMVFVALAAGAVAWSAHGFWAPAMVAAPLLAVEGWFDVRSRGRHLVPELAGAIGVCAVAPMVVLAGGGDGHLAVGAWLILAARVATSIPHVRAQIARLHQRPADALAATAGDVAAVAAVVVATAVDRALAAGAAAVIVVVAIQRVAGARPVPRPAVLGARQMAMGFGVVVATAAGVFVAAN